MFLFEYIAIPPTIGLCDIDACLVTAGVEAIVTKSVESARRFIFSFLPQMGSPEIVLRVPKVENYEQQMNNS